MPSSPIDAGAMVEGDNGFDRFTERAKRCVLASQEKARTTGNDSMTAGHILLALLELEDDDGPLRALGLRDDEVEGRVVAMLATARDARSNP